MGPTLYRTGVWFMKGLREYTRSGYENACKRFDSLEGIDLSGRSFLITGANSGIGEFKCLYAGNNFVRRTHEYVECHCFFRERDSAGCSEDGRGRPYGLSKRTTWPRSC